MSCNNEAGCSLDSHIKSGRDLQDIRGGNKETWSSVTAFGHTIQAVTQFGPGGIVIKALPDHSDPAEHAGVFDKLRQLSSSGDTDWTFTVQFTRRYSQWLESVAWLRAAYLYVFAALGYRFIFRPELECVREQIRRPRELIVPEAMANYSTSLGDGISFVYFPREIRSVVVRLGERAFFFPGLTEIPGFYQLLGAFLKDHGNLKIEGLHIELPQWGRFEFDHRPESAWLTLPPEERHSPAM